MSCQQCKNKWLNKQKDCTYYESKYLAQELANKENQIFVVALCNDWTLKRLDDIDLSKYNYYELITPQ